MAQVCISEVSSLKISDIDSDRMVLKVEQGKGSKDRCSLLSPMLLDDLRTWWEYANKKGLMVKGGWLFPGRYRIGHIYTPNKSRVQARGYCSQNRQTRIYAHT